MGIDTLSIEFVVPINGATESAMIDSDTSWENFLYKMSSDMQIRRDILSLVYRFSTQPKKDLPRALNKPAHYATLWDDTRKELAELEVKKKTSKAKPKELKVILVDLTEKPKGGTRKAVIQLRSHTHYLLT
jgi:hypothetical protein